jgi:hypothetical protein
VSTELQTMTGDCPSHGEVEATREIHGLRFPYVYYALVRAMARRRPYRCPTCGATVQTRATAV